MGLVYLGHPIPAYEGDPSTLVTRWISLPAAQRRGWDGRARAYARDASINAQDFCSMVLQSPGPVVLLRPIQNGSLEEIRRRLGARVPVFIEDATSDAELSGIIEKAVGAFEAGEPLIALDLVVALLVMEKLDQEHMWGGYAKSYMWADDISKGRGVSEKYALRVPHVINVLFQRGILIQKTSQGAKKYALNPDRRQEIHEWLRQRKLPQDVEGPLLRHPVLESVRALDSLSTHEPNH